MSKGAPEHHFKYASFHLFSKIEDNYLDIAKFHAEKAISSIPQHLPTRHLLLSIYYEANSFDNLKKLIDENLMIMPNDEITLKFKEKYNQKMKNEK